MKHINDGELYGLQITNTIVPCTDEDKYATHDSQYGLGGWHEVETIEQRNAIPAQRRRVGMACFVKQNSTLYILKGNLLNSSWSVYTAIDSTSVKDIISDAIASGAITVDVDLTNYYTSSEVDELLSTYSDSTTITNEIASATEEIKTWVEAKGYLTEHQSLADYMTRDEITAELDTRDEANKTYVDTALTNYYTITEADEKFLTKADAEATYVSLSTYNAFIEENAANLTSLTTQVQNIADTYVTAEALEAKGYIGSATVDEILGTKGYVTTTSLATYLESNDYINVDDLKGYATVAYVTDAINNSSYLTVSDLKGYATEAWVTDYVAAQTGGSGSGTIDLSSYVTKNTFEITMTEYTKTADLATVALTGSYNDLTDIPEVLPSTAENVSYLNGDITTVQEALDQLLYVAPRISSFTGGNTYEIGSTVNTVTLNWTLNKTVTSQSLNQGIGAIDATLRTYTISDAALTSNTTYTLTVSDGTNSATASTSLYFRYKRYWGTSANTELTNEEILALSQEYSTSRTQSRTFDCSGGQYFYLVIPTEFCSGISFKVNGLAFSAVVANTIEFTNASGYTASYNVYRPTNIQTGSAINVEVS